MRRPPTTKQKIDALYDIWAFADLIGFRGGSKAFASFHRDLTKFLCETQRQETEDNRRRLILAPRGHLKSTVCSVLYVMWRIYRNPDIRILVASNLKRLSRAFIRELRQYFEDKWLQDNVWSQRPHIEGQLVPALSAADRRKRNSLRNNNDGDDTASEDTKFIWSMEALQMNRPTLMKEPTVQALSVGTTVTGDHYDLLILDDIVDFDNSNTEDKAENIIEWTRDLESVLDPRQEHSYTYAATGKTENVKQIEFIDYVGDESVVLGTRYYQWDYYGYIIEEKELLGYVVFSRNVYVNGDNDEDGYLWPERFSASVVELIQRRLNSFRRFASQYLNRIVTSDEQTLPPEQVQYLAVSSISALGNGEVEVKTGLTTKVKVRVMLVVDPAVSQKKTADNTVLTVGGYDSDKKLYIFDIRCGKYTPSETVKHIFELADKWQLNSVTLETVGGFAMLSYIVRDAFKTHRPLAIREFRPKGEKKARIENFLEPHWVNSSVYLSWHLNNVTQLKAELDSFPLGHDDILDTFAIVAELCTPAVKSSTRRAQVPRKQYNNRYGGVR